MEAPPTIHASTSSSVAIDKYCRQAKDDDMRERLTPLASPQMSLLPGAELSDHKQAHHQHHEDPGLHFPHDTPEWAREVVIELQRLRESIQRLVSEEQKPCSQYKLVTSACSTGLEPKAVSTLNKGGDKGSAIMREATSSGSWIAQEQPSMSPRIVYEKVGVSDTIFHERANHTPRILDEKVMKHASVNASPSATISSPRGKIDVDEIPVPCELDVMGLTAQHTSSRFVSPAHKPVQGLGILPNKC